MTFSRMQKNNTLQVDTQMNDNQQNDTLQNDSNDNQQNDAQRNDVEKNALNFDTLKVAKFEYYFVKWHSSLCHYVKGYSDECRGSIFLSLSSV